MNFTDQLKNKSGIFNIYLEKYMNTIESTPYVAHQDLKKSINYSLFGKGKRFRPCLSMLVAECLGSDIEKVLPWCLAVEMVHTYSLIHDDLPCMDNDDYRRGELTNHKVFGEDVALLAGDALLTEAFLVIAKNYDEQVGQLVQILSEAAGFRGMVGGQAIDLGAQKTKTVLDELNTIHKLKTGALIKATALGAAFISSNKFQDHIQMSEYGEYLGLAFQIADDLLDYNPQDLEPGSYPAIIGYKETEQKLLEVTQNGISAIASYGSPAKDLMDLLEYNLTRDN